jgi:uncharacterized membrane protein YgdD (TMEM256/DUF423 family)
MQRAFLQLSALLGLFAVISGTMAAHLLKERLSAYELGVFETAARYHMYHAIALAVVAALAGRIADRRLAVAGWCFVAGIVIFSGSLYALALTGEKRLGAVAPLGGLSFMLGWIFLFLAAQGLPKSS